MAVIGFAGQRLGVNDKLAAFRVRERRRDRDLHAELVRLVRLAFADAFDLRRMQAEDAQIVSAGVPLIRRRFLFWA